MGLLMRHARDDGLFAFGGEGWVVPGFSNVEAVFAVVEVVLVFRGLTRIVDMMVNFPL